MASHGATPIVLGGDHSITYPSAAAVSGHAWPSSVGVLHFDAHADTGADQWGNLYGHGQPMRRLIEEGWVAGRNFVQVGLRGYWPDRETFAWMPISPSPRILPGRSSPTSETSCTRPVRMWKRR